jgi:hypothetical protein
MVRAAVAGWRIAMPRLNHLDLHFLRARHGRLEIVKLEPQEHAVAMRQILVTDWTVIVSHIPAMQLQDQPSTRGQTLVLGSSVCTSTTKQTLIPATARFDIVHANQRLWAHYSFAK